MSDELIRKHEGHVTHLTLNRPQKANALSGSVVEALLDAAEYACTDGTRLLILDGAGPHFCAGFDFSGMEERAKATSPCGSCASRRCCSRSITRRSRRWLSPMAARSGRAPTSFAAAGSVSQRRPRHFACRGCASASRWERAASLAASARTARARFFAHRANSTPRKRIGFVTRIAAQDEWPRIAASARANCELLTPAAAAALHRRTVTDTRAEDMAELARSVSVPGLKERIRLYRETSR